MTQLEAALLERRGPVPRRPGDRRSPFERDRARIIHSAAFRRLQAKTQVLDVGEGDFYRTRLTHSLEVAQIGRGLLTHLAATRGAGTAALPAADLVEAICLAHDLGHPPFGHDGEKALNFCLVRQALREGQGVRDGFEGNGQTLRLLARLESHTPGYGLNLTRRTLLGVLKYPRTFAQASRRTWPQAERPLDLRPWEPPKCVHTVEADLLEWALAPFDGRSRAHLGQFAAPTDQEHAAAGPMTLDASLLEVADDIAYGTHDLEDGLVLGLLPAEALDPLAVHERTSWARRRGLAGVARALAAPPLRKQAVGALVNALVGSARLEPVGQDLPPLLAFRVTLEPEAAELLELLKELVRQHVIGSPQVRALRLRAGQMMIALYDALASDPERLLPREEAARLPDEGPARVIVDHLASLTDRSAVALYRRLYVP